MKIGIIIQARLNSTRLPSKVLKKLPGVSNKTVIEHIIYRAQKVEGISTVILATSNQPEDDLLVDFIEKKQTGVSLFRGDEQNVLERYYQAAVQSDLTHIVRLTGDNPCIDIKSIEQTVKYHLDQKAAYTYTKGYPLGMNIEVVALSALQIAHQEGKTNLDREHVTYFVRRHPKRFRIATLYFELSKSLTDLRLTLDDGDDYILLQLLFDYLDVQKTPFSINDIAMLWQNKPYIFYINKNSYQKKIHVTPKAELQVAHKLLTLQELHISAGIIQQKLEQLD